MNCSLSTMWKICSTGVPSHKEIINFLEDDRRDFGVLFDWESPWSPRDVSSTRLGWTKCYGIPINAWNDDLFQFIGNSVGISLK